MKNIRQNLLKAIQEKAEKIKQRKEDSRQKQITVESIVFDFFKDVEDAYNRTENNGYYNLSIMIMAAQKCEELLRLHIDPGCKIRIEYKEEREDISSITEIRGITIFWSLHHMKKNNCDSSTYIDVGAMILF